APPRLASTIAPIPRKRDKWLQRTHTKTNPAVTERHHRPAILVTPAGVETGRALQAQHPNRFRQIGTAHRQRIGSTVLHMALLSSSNLAVVMDSPRRRHSKTFSRPHCPISSRH